MLAPSWMNAMVIDVDVVVIRQAVHAKWRFICEKDQGLCRFDVDVAGTKLCMGA